ncbi:hypothetical protein BD626DRAFT_495544, partial [Schizophyllum amplum]
MRFLGIWARPTWFSRFCTLSPTASLNFFSIFHRRIIARQFMVQRLAACHAWPQGRVGRVPCASPSPKNRSQSIVTISDSGHIFVT